MARTPSLIFHSHPKVAMSHFDKHVFFCTNQRANSDGCCNNFGAQKLRDYVKDKVKQLGISNAENRIRINSAGCLDRCDEGLCW